jgi:hypothetical protein
LHEASDPAFRPAHHLLTRIFPLAETTPRAAWKHAMRERAAAVWTDFNWHLFVAESRGRVIGAATGFYLGDCDIGMIGYVAAAAAARSAGIGTRLRWALRLAFERDAARRGRRLRAIMGEVHADNPWLRRLVAVGAIALDFPYFQPSLRSRGAQVALVLYYQPLGAARASLPTADVRRMVYAIWRRVYRIRRPLAYASFRAMLRALAGRSRIGQRALAPPRRRR